MHEVLGSRPSVDPPVVVSSFTEEEPITISMESVDFSEITAVSTIGTTIGPLQNSSEETASSSTASSMVVASPPTPSPKKRKRKSNPTLDFLAEESIKEQKRHEESEAKTERFLNLFEKMINKF
ncbi:hypothetical protein ABG768_024610 [Culter alburnus]|uniref:Uncharacterized protein n=1 Tax=Culter alburnus TaxID=194366 RepID=A0AAW2AC79_CULAL